MILEWLVFVVVLCFVLVFFEGKTEFFLLIKHSYPSIQNAAERLKVPPNPNHSMILISLLLAIQMPVFANEILLFYLVTSWSVNFISCPSF